MAITIDNPEVEETLKALSAATGEPLDVSVTIAVRERLDRVTKRKGHELLEAIRDIQDRVAAMPELDPRPADEIIGYNEFGMFD
jgi:antitoxin VapB